METNENAMQYRIRQLAIQARGTRKRPEIVPLLDGMSLGSYFNFETGRVWPQATNLRKIENAYGWKSGILTELTGSDVDPATVNLDTLKGGMEEGRPAGKASELSDEELMFELMRRMTSLRADLDQSQQTIEHMFEQAREEGNNSNTDPVNNSGVTKRRNHEAFLKNNFGLAARRTHKHDS